MPEYSCCQMRLPTLEPSFFDWRLRGRRRSGCAGRAFRAVCRAGRSRCAGRAAAGGIARLVETDDSALLVEAGFPDRHRCAACLQTVLFRNGCVDGDGVIAIIGNGKRPLAVGSGFGFRRCLAGQRDGDVGDRLLVGVLQDAVDAAVAGGRIAFIDGLRAGIGCGRDGGREYEKHRENGDNRTEYDDSRSTMPCEIRYGCHRFFLSCCFHNVGEETARAVALRFPERYPMTARVT